MRSSGRVPASPKQFDHSAKKMTTQPKNTQPRNRTRIGLVIAVGLVAALVVWLLVKGNDNGSNSAPAPVPQAGAQTLPAQSPVEISARGLTTLATAQPIYWAGERPGTKLELTVTSSGNVFVRYLDKATPIGAKNREFLTVGTYPVSGALELLQHEATRTNAVTKQLNGGGLVLVDKSHPQSVYVAYPGIDYQVEVYDPTPKQALDLVLSAAVGPIG